MFSKYRGQYKVNRKRSKSANYEYETTETTVVERSMSASVEKALNEIDNLEINDENTDNLTISQSEDDLHKSADNLNEKGGELRRGGFRNSTINFDEKIPTFPKHESELSAIHTAFFQNEFLSNILKQTEITSIIEAMYLRRVIPEEQILKQGDFGNCMFVSFTGKYEIIIDNKSYRTFDDIRVFGELAILYSNPRYATIKALTEGTLWVLKRNVFKQLVKKKIRMEEEEMLSFLRSVPTVNKASDEKLKRIAYLFKNEFFKTDTKIIHQGEKGDNFYIIRAGIVNVEVDDISVAKLIRGDFFGELALLHEDVRQATIRAEAPGVECLILSRQDFIEYLGDLPSFISKEDKKVVEEISYGEKYELNNFERIRIIGVGGFGQVELVKHLVNKKFYCLKSQKKHTTIKNLAYNEKFVQSSCQSNFIVKLHNTFQDKKYLYFLLEFCRGGDLWGLMHLMKKRYFDEDSAKFVSACVLEALSYLHERQIAYLDLKPENVVIDSVGYLKLADFGNAIYVNRRSHHSSFAGTPEYISPEIILQRDPNQSADCWAFGIFIFELLVGHTPFRKKKHEDIYHLIIKGFNYVKFPSKVANNAENLIKRLCKPNPAHRLGYLKNGMDDVRKHKWYNGFKWDKLQKGSMQSPCVPPPNFYEDNKYFESFMPDKDVPPDCEIWENF